MDDAMARVTCSCGFTAVGEDEFNNRYALEEHPCPNRPVEPPQSAVAQVARHVFGMWTAVIAVMAAIVAIRIWGN